MIACLSTDGHNSYITGHLCTHILYIVSSTSHTDCHIQINSSNLAHDLDLWLFNYVSSQYVVLAVDDIVTKFKDLNYAAFFVRVFMAL